MGNRGHKRAEKGDDLPVDKRACSSLESRPSSSKSWAQTQTNSTTSTTEAHDGDMDTSSSTSRSSRSEGEAEKDSAYGSCDSDGGGDAEHRQHSFMEYQQRRLLGDSGKFKKVLSSLSEDDDSGILAALTELCELLSFCTDGSLSSLLADSLSPILVKLARHESNPDIMLLAIRAMTYLCEAHPQASSFLVRHDAVTALCQRLMAIEYLDVAEQCLQALEKMSREQPLACLQSGAIMAVLSYVDFFSTSVQRVALSTVVNICKKLPSESPPPLMEAVPILCNLLQYEDRQLVENVTTCLIKIVEHVSKSSDMVDDLCKYGLINQATHLIDLNSGTTLSQPIYTGLIGLLVKLASGSIVAVRSLYELNISSVAKEILSSYGLSHGMPSPNLIDGHCNQVHEVLKLLNELLPTLSRDQDTQFALDKEAFLESRPDLLQKFGTDLLPVLIEVVNTGSNLYVCYGCLSVISKFVYFSKSDTLLELLKNANISSFLAGVFTRKDHHVLLLALQITDAVLQKLSSSFLNSFVKEGVYFSIDALQVPEKSNDPSQKSPVRDVPRCLCSAFVTGQSPSTSATGTCKLSKDSVHNLAKQIKTNYFSTELLNHEKGFTDILQKLRTLSTELTDLVNMSVTDDTSGQHEEDFYCILRQVMGNLIGRDSVSTFEFIESGIVKSLVNYLLNGQYMRSKAELNGTSSHLDVVVKRFEVFGRLFISSSDPPLEHFRLSVLIQKLLSALSSVETFPVIVSYASKQRNSYAAVPFGRCLPYPCLRVQFVRGEGETSLCEYSGEVLTVDPFASLEAIEAYLWPKVSSSISKCTTSSTHTSDEMDISVSRLLSEAGSAHNGSPDRMESDCTPSDLQDMQEDKPNVLNIATEEAASSGQTTGGTTSLNENHIDPTEQGKHSSSKDDSRMSAQCSASCCKENASPKISFYLEGQLLDPPSSLYQAIIQQCIESEHEIVTSAKLWSQVYKVTYRRAVKSKQMSPHSCQHRVHDSSLLDKVGTFWQYVPFFSGVVASNLEKSSATYDILSLLRNLEGMNRFRFHLVSREKIYAFAEGKIEDLDNLKVVVAAVHQNEFVSSKLTEKLEQQMRDPLAVSLGGMPSWCSQLMGLCPFLFTFEARCKYLHLAVFDQQQLPLPPNNSGGENGRRQSTGSLPRKKFLVSRDSILQSAAKMMDIYARQKVVLEVEYNDEVGTGLGPTLEFYTLVSREFQKSGLDMWREDHISFTSRRSFPSEDSGILISPFGLFPRPWSGLVTTSNGTEFSQVLKMFVLLGQIVAKALQDGRVLDLPFSKAFYKLVLGQELTIYDIHSFDPGLGKALLEFQALVERKKQMELVCGNNSTFELDACFRNSKIEDLCLDFTLPGYPDYVLTSGPDTEMVNMLNLEGYISLIVDATINAGIQRQVEAFKSGFNQVFPIKHLQIFTEDELERLLCGDELWTSNQLSDHIKFDHGYTASSPPVVNLLEIIQEFDREQQRAFLQFVTGAPQLPPGGLASLNPKLTVVRKHCNQWADADLPSVMTCANYLKLPPYSSKEMMRDKVLYAIKEGQGSFHLS